MKYLIIREGTRMNSLRSDAEKATGQSNSPKLWPGTRFTLTGHPQKMLNREWQVVQSILSGDQPQALHGSRGEEPRWAIS